MNNVFRHSFTHTASLLLALTLTISLVVPGCALKPQSPMATTAAPYEDQNTEGSDSSSEKKTQAQNEFSQLTSDLFKTEAASSQLNLHFLLKDPAACGIAPPQSLYGSASLESAQAATAELAEFKTHLDDFDLSLLTEDQKLTLRILKSYANTSLSSSGLELYEQPLAPTIGIQAQLPVLLSEYEFYSRQDIDDYLKLIEGLSDYYSEILAYEHRQADAGLMMSDTAIDHVIESCESYLLVPGDNFMIDTFNTRLNTVDGLTAEEKAAYQQQNAALLESAFTPAYTLLIDGMKALKGTGIHDGGLCNYPDGKKYYEYLVYSGTGTSYASVDEMLQAMELLMEENLSKVSELLKTYPNLSNEINTYQFRQTDPDAMMEELKKLCQEDFPPLPKCNYKLKYVPKALELSLPPAFYLLPPIDDYQNNTIYINPNPRFSGNVLYNTIAHEGYPGHLYQNVYFRSKNTDPIRQIMSFLGYSEGWATYVETYSCTLDNGLSPEMGELLAANKIASLGLQACLDVYINYKGWSKAQVTKYLRSYYQDPTEIAENLYNTMVENPSNYVSYYVGYLEIHNMEKAAQEKLGDRFNRRAFHEFLLDLGPAPFDVIQPYFTSWLLSQKL